MELDIELENDILEWSEKYSIHDDALVSLIDILKKRTCKRIDLVTQREFKTYLEDLKVSQNAILKEINHLREESSNIKSNNFTPVHTKRVLQRRILDFPIKSVKHFQRLEGLCAKNGKIFERLTTILLSTDVPELSYVEDVLKVGINMLFDQKMLQYIGKSFNQVKQIENCSIFRCLKEAVVQKNLSKNEKEIYSSILFICKEFGQMQNYAKCDSLERKDENEFDFSFLYNLLPCNTIDELQKFDKYLRKLSNFGELVLALFKSAAKTDVKEFINFAMNTIIGENIALLVEWEDKTNTCSGIKDFEFTNIIFEHVRQEFDETISDDDIKNLIQEWLEERKTDQVEEWHIIDERKDKMMGIEVSETSNFTSNKVSYNNMDEDMCEEFLEEDENIFHMIPCKTEQMCRKLEEQCRLDLNLQSKLKQIFQPAIESNSIGNTNYDEDIYMTVNSYEAQDDYKRFIEYNIRKIFTDQIISGFSWLNNTESLSNETSFYDDNIILRILHDCVQQSFPNLTVSTIRNEIIGYLQRTKENFTNYNMIAKAEECRLKIQNVPAQEIITPDSHSIHLQAVLNLPINNLEALWDFNMKCLNDEEMSLNLMSMFLQVSETDCNKFVDKNLRKLITEEMGSKLTWNGIQHNIAVKDFYIMKLLIDAAKKHFSGYGEESIIDSIKLALRRFKDRIRKRKSCSLSLETEQNENITYYNVDEEVIENNDEELKNDDYQLIVDDIVGLKRIPCKTIREFQNMEKLCKNHKELQENLKYLFDSNTNDKDPVKFMSENLKRIAFDYVLGHFTYNGLKNNICVKYYTTIRILMDSLIGKNPYLSEEDAISTLKKALLLAKDRQRSIYKKKKKENSD